MKQCADPLARDLREPILAFRPFPPLVAYGLGGGMVVSLLLPPLASIGMLALVHQALWRRVGLGLARWTTLLVATTAAVS